MYNGVFCVAALLICANSYAQTENIAVPELHTEATLTFEPVPGSPPPYLAVTIDPALANPSPAIAVTIECNGHKERFVRTASHAIQPIPRTRAEEVSTGIARNISGLKPDPSRLFFISTGIRTLLFFMSVGEASDAAPAYVLGFKADGTPYRVLVRDQFDVTSVSYGPGATVRIVGQASLPQAYAEDPNNSSPKTPYATSYDPASVLVVSGNGAATYSLPLSKAYNLEHYIWYGPKGSEGYAVLYNIPGHSRPFGVPATQVDDWMARARKMKQNTR